jgi:hypothetical protein
MSGNVMSRKARAFRQSDVVRLVRAVMAAGLSVQRIEHDNDGRISVVTGEELSAVPVDDLDQELADFKVRHGQG